MRSIVMLVVVFMMSGQLFAQGASAETSPGIEIIKHGWAKVRIDWLKDPLTNPTSENFNEMRARVSTERRPRSPMEERKISAAREEKQKPPPPPKYIFEYKVVIQNTSSKAIKEIDWDYVFIDSVSGEVLGRHQFTSVEKASAGKRKDLRVKVSSPPTNRVSVHSLGKDEHEGIVEKIMISRIMYDDGSVWQGVYQ